MKKRLLSLALAATMLFGSINLAVAEETPVPASGEAVQEQAEEVELSADAVASAAALTLDAEEEAQQELTHYPVETAGDWLASVSGDVGGQEKIVACTKNQGGRIGIVPVDFALLTDPNDNSKVPSYEIKATDIDAVYMRAGTTNRTSNTAGEAVGKLASTSNGMAYYYQKVSSDKDFVMSATARVIAVDNTNNQVGFGVVATDELVVDCHYPEATKVVPPMSDTALTSPNMIGAGRVRMKEAGKSSGRMMNGWYYIDSELYGSDTSRSSFLDEGLACDASISAPVSGSVYDISMRKSGSVYTLTVDDGTKVSVSTVDAAAGHGADGKPLTFTDNMCVGVAVTRNCEIAWTDLDLTITKPVVAMQLVSEPTQKEYYYSEDINSEGLAVEVTYNDGEKAVITDPSQFNITSSACTSLSAPNALMEIGEQTIEVSIGSVEPIKIKINVRPMKIVKQEIKYAAAENDFFVGNKFDPAGLTVRYYFEDGSHEDLAGFKNNITINGKTVNSGDVLTADMAGESVPVKLEYPENPNYDLNGCSSTYNITLNEGVLANIAIGSYPSKTIYFIGDEADYAGLTVQAGYLYNGKKYYRYIGEDEYSISELKTDVATDKYTLTITYVKDPTKTTTMDVSVRVPRALSAGFITNPRYTYAVGEVFDPDGINIQAVYDSGATVPLCADGIIYMYDGTKYYTSDGETVEADKALAADYYIDLTGFDTSKAGAEATATVIYNKNVVNFKDSVLTCTVVENTDYVWKAALLGSSSVGVKNVGTSEIYANIKDENGNVNEYFSDKAQHNIEPQVMINGKLPQVESVRLNSWDGCGKVSGDQDGIAYYYTRVSNKNNFKISADVTVNRYIREADKLSADDQKLYDRYYAWAKTQPAYAGDEDLCKRVALDRLRSGQECFGIMAKDVVQFAGGTNASGGYTGNLNNHMTINPDEAMQSTVTYTDASGATKTVSTPVDLYEAYVHNLPAYDYVINDDGSIKKDENGNPVIRKTYYVSYEDVNNIFASNMVVAAACTDSTWPTDPNTSTYYKKTQMNRFNIMMRRGVNATDGGGERVGILPTTDKLPEAGETYKVTLEKITGGYMITTHDYQTGNTVTKKLFEEEYEAQNVLGIQDNDNIYVGFYASRWADCTVSNISLYETDPETDPIYSNDVEEAVSPKISVTSPLYVQSTSYSLGIKASNDSGGYCTISQNGKTIYSNVGVGRKVSSRAIQLEPNAINRFTIVYYPSTADYLTSYDPVTYTFNVTHSSIEDDKVIYVGPNGTVAGAGTRENPLDLESALGLVAFGGSITMLDGTYTIKNTDAAKISIPSTYSGSEGNPKMLKADEGATPVVDLEGLYDGFSVDADYWIFDGITVTNSGGNMKPFQLGGQYNIVRNCTFHDNGDTGFQISRINSSDTTMDSWPSYNLIQSCESYNNCDPSKNNADGFAAKLTVGYGNVFEDCISHHNLDDGWDCYTKLSTGAIGPSVLENCITYRQGFRLFENGAEEDFDATSGGNGFKLGGENINVIHYIKDCKTFENKSAGVDSNSNPALKARNVILYNNIMNNFYLYSGTNRELIDAKGRKYDDSERPYKFDYDIKGAVSVGSAVDQIGSFNTGINDVVSNTTYYEDDTVYGNVSVNPIVSESNYLKKYADTEEVTYTQQNSLGETIDPNTFFVSTNKNETLVNGRYQRNADGTFDHGTFLERAVPYVHDAADEVTLPSPYGDKGGTSSGENTPTTESTTSAYRPSGGGGGGGGGGGSSIKAVTTTTTEATTTAAATDKPAPEKKPIITKDVIVTIGESIVKVGSDDIAVDAAPYIQTASNSTLVPLRVVSLAIMGGNVADADSSEAIKWDGNTKTATILAGDKVVQFTAGSEVMVVDQKTMVMDNGVKAEITDGRMYVPFRALGKALDVEVEWDAEARAAKYIAPTEATTEEVTEETTALEDETAAEAETATTEDADTEETTVEEEEASEATTAEEAAETTTAKA